MAPLVVMMRSIFLALAFGAAIWPKDPKEVARVDVARTRAKEYIAVNLAKLGLASLDDIKEKRVFLSRASVTLRYQQMHAGVPVLFGELIFAVGTDVRLVFNNLIQTLEVDPKPVITPEDATRRALKASRLEARAKESEPILIIVPKHSFVTQPDRDRLAWEVNVWSDDEKAGTYSHRFYVDAHDGEIIRDLDRVYRD